MKVISRKIEPKFTRKPNIPIQKQLVFPTQQYPSIVSSTKKLQINNNVFNLIVTATNEDKEIELSRLLFTNQKSLDWKSSRIQQETIHNSTLSKKHFLEYSPDSIICSSSKQFNLNDSQILIDGYQKRLQKMNPTTIPATSFTFQKSEECAQIEDGCTKVSAFQLVQVEKKVMQTCSITISFISFNRNIFMLNYSFQSQARNTLSEQVSLFKGDGQRLINRLRVFFRKYPLLMFAFYHDVLSEYENILLREFLMKNAIKYSTNQIISLQAHINQALDMCKGENLLEYIFMTAEEDDMVIVNLSETSLQNQISLTETNLWKAMTPLLQKLPHHGAAGFQIRKIEEFIIKLL